MNFSHLSKIVEGTLLQLRKDNLIEFLITDSRKIYVDAGAVFIALKGVRHDGHKYIDEVYKKGIRQFLIEEDKSFALKNYPEANFYKTPNALLALQAIAAHHRAQFKLKVLAVTGSNGKTIVKEWLSQLLSSDFTLVKSPKSYNSQLGVPLSVWEINDKHQLGIFEAGISRPGEMENLEKVIRPELGLISGVLKYKARIFCSIRNRFFLEALVSMKKSPWKKEERIANRTLPCFSVGQRNWDATMFG